MLPPDHFSVSLIDDSCDKICKTFKQAWPHFLSTNLNRKGTGDFIPHPSLTAQVLSSFAPEDQGLLIRNAGGGFQTAATQNLCGLEDGRSHRCLECPSMDEVRTRHPEAVSILQNDRPDWVYIPLAHSSPEVVLQRAFLKTIKVESDLPQFDAVNKITLYTDGGAINPSDPDARLASWAVVADTSDLSVKGTQVVSEHMGSSLHCPLLKVVGCGLAYGHQSAARGELLAFCHALRVAEKYDNGIETFIVTGASYVCFINFVLRQGNVDFPNHKVRNGDIIKLIKSHWNPRVKVLKTRRHRTIEEATDWFDLWTLYGNFVADFAAPAVLKRVPQAVTDMLNDLATFRMNEAARLQKVFTYLVDLNRYQIDAVQQGSNIVGQPDKPEVDVSNFLMPPKAMGVEALEFLKSYEPSHFVHLFDENTVDRNTYGGSIQGASFTAAVVKWLAHCRWPPDIQNDYSRNDNWGISWLVLLFSFVLFSGMYPPVKTGGKKADAVFLNYSSGEALMLPASTRSASKTYLFASHFGYQNHHIGSNFAELFIQKVPMSPSLQFYWYVCWFAL